MPASASGPTFQIGDEVRLKLAPTQSGHILQGPRTSGGRPFWHVRFGPGTSWKPERQLEPAPDSSLPPTESLRRGVLGSLADLRRVLTHVLVSGRLHDTLYSLEASNTEFFPYQYKPVLRLLESPSRRVLIADEVGLGKTIEAGLIWTELRARVDARRLVVVCPKALREKWRRELRYRFGVDARICPGAKELRAELAARRRGDQAWIVSTSSVVRWRRPKGARLPRGSPQRDWEDPGNPLAPARLARLLAERTAAADHVADLLVVDEAHHCRNPETNLHEIVRLMTEASDHTVLLSATPVHNRQRDLAALLRLLDPDTFWDSEVVDREVERNQPLMRLSRAGVTRADVEREAAGLPARDALTANLRSLIRGASEGALEARCRSRLQDALERANFLATFIVRTRKRDVQRGRVTRDPVPQSVPMRRLEREYYEEVTAAVRDYARNLKAHEKFLAAQPQRLMASCMTASLERFLSADVEEQDDDLDDDEDVAADVDPADGPRTRRPLIAAIRRRIEARWPTRARLIRELEDGDTKYGLLVQKLREHFRERPDAKLVLFSSFRGTVDYLGQRLARDGISNLVVKGGDPGGTDAALQRFERPDGPGVLVSTEVSSEGVDLQFCELLINYDLPWNPMRVEQRIGRLDRIGQKASRIVIWTLLHEDTIDARIHELLHQKMDIFRRALGDIEPIVGQEMRNLTGDLLSGRLTVEQQQERIEQTQQALENRRRQEEQLEGEAPGLLGVGEIIERRISDAKRSGRLVTGNHLRRYVVEFLQSEYIGTDLRRTRGDVFELRLAADAAMDLSDFCRRDLLTAGTRLTDSGRWVKCRFGNRPVRDARLEAISQFHPLTRFVAARLRERQERGELYVAAPVRLMGVGSIAPGTYVLAIRLEQFADASREVRLFHAAERLGGGERLTWADARRLADRATTAGEDWHGWRGAVDLDEAATVADDLFFVLAARADEVGLALEERLEQRVQAQLEAIERAGTRARDQARSVARRHREKGRENLARATEAKVRMELARLKHRRRRALDLRRGGSSQSAEVALALVRVPVPDSGRSA